VDATVLRVVEEDFAEGFQVALGRFGGILGGARNLLAGVDVG